MSIPLREELAQHLRCSSCDCIISFGPVTKSSSGYQCGRCPSGFCFERNSIYETLASDYLFPCQYNDSGCNAILPFGVEIRNHELNCPKRQYKCPILPSEKCQWQDQFDRIEQHANSDHKKLVLKNLILEIHLDCDKEIRYVYFCKSRGLILVDLIFNRTGLSVVLQKTVNDINDEEYQMVLCSSDRKYTMTFSKLSYTFLPCAKTLRKAINMVDINLLRHIDSKDKKLLINFELKQPSIDTVHKESAYLCKNQIYGCSYVDFYQETRNHEKDCIACPCPLGSDVCEWKGIISLLEEHCRKNHNDVIVSSSTINVDLKQIASSEKTTHFYLVSSYFRPWQGMFRICVRLENDATICVNVQIVGTTKEDVAKQYKYTMQLKGFTKLKPIKTFDCQPYAFGANIFKCGQRFCYDQLKEHTIEFNLYFY